MQIIQKADGFEAQKIFVVPNTLLNEYILHPLVKPLYATDIGYFPRAQFHYRERPGGCDTSIFIYCVEGEGWAILPEQQKISLVPGTLLVIPAFTPHIYGAAETNPWSIYWFHVKGEKVGAFIDCFSMENATLYVPASEGVHLTSLIEQCYETLLYKAYSFKHFLYVSQVMHSLLGSITLLQGNAHKDERKNIYIERTIQYMLENVQSSLSLDELATHIQISKPHFIHLFKQMTGYSAIEYYMRLKIQRACQYLDLTDLSIKEVSKRVGIQDPYYFSRVFTKIMGLPPTEYRKRMKG